MKILPPFCLAALALTAAPAFAQDATSGANLFKQRCQMCHSVVPGQKMPLGPNLAKVVGRKSGTGEFAYSEAMKKAALTWTPEQIDSYLASPPKVVPGGKMVINVADPKIRANIIAFLKTK